MSQREFEKNSPLRSSLKKHVISRTKSPAGRKTVSFCSRNADKKVSNVNECLQFMQKGTEIVKLRTNVRQFRRVFSLDADLSYIRWSPTNKKPHKARIAVNDIKEIRVGWNTELLRTTEISGDIQEECAFSIIHGENYECLDLIALTPGDANIWVTGLMAISGGLPSVDGQSPLVPSISNSNVANFRERWLTKLFNESDVDQKGYITEKAASKLIRAINPRLMTSRIKQKIKETIISSANDTAIEQLRDHIDVQQFVEIYKDIATRPEIYFLMVRYANKDYLNCQDLQLFLETEQGVLKATAELCENIIALYEPCPEAKEHGFMTVDGFTNFLMSSGNSVFDPTHLTVCQEMTQPFTNYYIATSYNTYLVEDQIKGLSSLDGYISALKRNCRFVEIDVWEPDSQIDDLFDEPVVCNGSPSGTKIPLGQVLEVINELAFERTKYPLFVRLEVHLNLSWQERLCDLLNTHLGHKLYRPKDDPTDWSLPENIPTPKKFMNRIILSSVCSSKSGDESILDAVEEDEGFELMKDRSYRRGMHFKLSRRLNDMIARFAQSKLVIDSNSPVGTEQNKLNAKRDIVSMSETNCLRMLHNRNHVSLIDPNTFYNRYREFLFRVTPNPNRIDSSNLNPQEFWNFGLSLVALNYQTPGLMMDLQEGKFLANGGCGYVLKPSVMRNHQFCPTERLPMAFPQVLHIKIHSAQQLPRPRASTAKGDSADPYIVLEVFGVPGDCAEERSKTVRNDSFNPTFDENFQFEIGVPELALVRFLVLDDEFIDDDFIGQYTIPFECLQSGYRHIPLLNNEGDPLENCTIFVHIAITNRRGGGKAKKRGLSVRRKTNRTQSGMKTIGIKSMDDQFKVAAMPLIKFIEMKNQLETTMTSWQEECGLAQTSTIRQGLRIMHSRIIAADGANAGKISPDPTTPLFSIVKNDEDLSVRVQGQVPETIEKSFTLLDSLLKNCSTIIQTTEQLLTALSEATRKITDCDFSQLCSEVGLKGQKATRATENYQWNVKLCRAQIMLMQTTLAEAREIKQQSIETAKALGILLENGATE